MNWTEDHQLNGAFAFSGPMLCEDVHIGPITKDDMVATCIPFKDHAIAAYVPDPHVYCR